MGPKNPPRTCMAISTNATAPTTTHDVGKVTDSRIIIATRASSPSLAPDHDSFGCSSIAHRQFPERHESFVAFVGRRMLALQAYLGPPRSEAGLLGIRPKGRWTHRRWLSAHPGFWGAWMEAFRSAREKCARLRRGKPAFPSIHAFTHEGEKPWIMLRNITRSITSSFPQAT